MSGCFGHHGGGSFVELKCLGQMVCCDATSGKLSTNVASKACSAFPGRHGITWCGVRCPREAEELLLVDLPLTAPQGLFLPCFKVLMVLCLCISRKTYLKLLMPCIWSNLNMSGGERERVDVFFQKKIFCQVLTPLFLSFAHSFRRPKFLQNSADTANVSDDLLIETRLISAFFLLCIGLVAKNIFMEDKVGTSELI